MKKINNKGKISIFTLLVVIALAIVLSIANVGLDFANFSVEKWLTNLGLTVGLSLCGMFLGEAFFTSLLQNETKENGLYQIELRRYNQAFENIKNDTIFFQQFLDRMYMKDIRTAKLNALLNENIDNAENILKLDIHDLDYLINPFKKEIEGKTYYFKSYTKKQVDFIKGVFDGSNIHVKRINKEFFLNPNGTNSGSSDYQEASKYKQEKGISLNLMRASKIGVSIILSAFVSTLTIKEFMDGANIEAWVNLLSRLVAIVGGFASGGYNAYVSNKIDIKYLRLRTRGLTEFRYSLDNEKEKYVQNDIEKEAQEEYKKYEEELKNIIKPEIIETANNSLLLEHKGGSING